MLLLNDGGYDNFLNSRHPATWRACQVLWRYSTWYHATPSMASGSYLRSANSR